VDRAGRHGGIFAVRGVSQLTDQRGDVSGGRRMSTDISIFDPKSRMNRRQFWVWIGCLLAVKYALAILLVVSPELGVLGAVDIVVVLFVALTIGARFRDTGWPGWVGILLTLMIMLVLPLVLLFAVISNRAATNPIEAFPGYVGWSSTVSLLALIIVAGT